MVSTFMYKILLDEIITIWGDETTKRDYICVANLARVCRIAAESKVTGVINAGSGIGLILVELVFMIETAKHRVHCGSDL